MHRLSRNVRLSVITMLMICQSSWASTGVLVDLDPDVVVYSPTQGVASFGLDLNGGGDDFVFIHNNDGNGKVSATLQTPGIYGAGILSTTDFVPKRLSAGDSIGTSGLISSLSWDRTLASNHGGTAEPGEFLDDTSPQSGYFGFSMSIGNAVWGWFDIEVAPLNPASHALAITIKGYAYDVDGDPILAGDVPEPTTASMFLMSLVVLSMAKRR